ncbi:MAG: nitroreductase family protein [bacterium]
MLLDLVRKNRSCRRFIEDSKIEKQTLRDLVNLGRHCPSGANLQPLKYAICNNPEMNNKIFNHIQWAGYLKQWNGPSPGQRPSAYIIVLGDKAIKKNFDHDVGIQAQTILLGAVELGFGGCMIGSIVDKKELREKLDIPETLDIILLIALGKPDEKIVLEDIKPDGDIKYYRDEKDIHHVPKRTLNEILVKEF